MANNLEIKASLDADGVTKGIDDINNELKSLETNAAKAGDKGAAAAEKWQTALESLKDAIPDGSDASGMDKVADSTTGAADAAQSAQGIFARLGQTLKGLATTVGGALRSGFAGLTSVLGTIGRAAGTAFMVAFRVAMVAVPIAGALAAALGYALYGAYGIAAEGGKKWMKTFTDAFSAGLDPATFNALKGALAGISDEASKIDLAKALGQLQQVMRTGGSAADQTAEIIKRLGGDVNELTKGGQATLEQFAKISESLSKLDTLQRREVLSKIFPSASVEQLAQADTMIRQLGDTFAKTSQQTAGAITQYAGALQQQYALGKAADAAKGGFMELVTALDEVTGASDTYRNAINLIPGILQQANIAFRALAEGVRALPGLFKSFGESVSGVASVLAKAVNDVFAKAVKIVTELGKAFALLAGVAWDGIKAGIGAIGSALSALLSPIDSVITKLQELYDAWDSAKKAGEAGAAMGGLIKGPRSVPLQSPEPSGLFRSFAAAPASTAQSFGLLRAPTARVGAEPANDNTVGGLTSAGWDKLLLNYKELNKEREKAAKLGAQESRANKATAESLVPINSALAAMLQSLGLSEAQLQEWVNSTVLAVGATDEWSDAQLRLKAALDAGMITTAQYAEAFSRLKSQMDTGPMQTAINDLQQGMQSFADTAASSLADAIVNGENLSDVFKNLAKQLASMLLQALVLKPLMNAITGGFGGGVSGFQAVAGGGVSALSAPQPFGLMAASAVPTSLTGLSNFAGRGANITPTQQVNQNVKSDITVNTGTGETAVTTNQGIAFGRQLEAAVQQVLVKEQRPGGSLYKRSAA